MNKDEILNKIHQMDSDSIGQWHDKVVLELSETQKEYYKLKDEKQLNDERLFIKKRILFDGFIKDNAISKTLNLVNQDKDVSDLKLTIMRQRRLLDGIELKIKGIKLKKEILKDNYFRNK